MKWDEFQFFYPWVVWATLGSVLFLTFIWTTRRRQQRKRFQKVFSEKIFAQISEKVSRSKGKIKFVLQLLALLFLGLALARPQWGFKELDIEIETSDVVFVLDVSRSMLASDLAPSRLERAKLMIFDLVQQMQGERVGLVGFAGEAFLQCPLTLDYDAFLRSLRALDTGSVPTGGSDIALAIEEAVLVFPEATDQKTLVMITDGEDLGEQGVAKAREVAKEGVKIFTVGAGSEQGDVITILKDDGNKDVLRDASGNPVVSRLDRDTLETIARETGGFYLSLNEGAQRMQMLYERGIALQDSTSQEERKKQIYNEWFFVPLSLALFFILLETMIHTRRK